MRDIDDPFKAKYLIVSLKGRVYSRRMMINTCTRLIGRGYGPHIRGLIDDHTFMAPLRGCAPAFVAREVWDRLAADCHWPHRPCTNALAKEP